MPVETPPSIILAQAILPALQLPFALFGHSMGALIGFELVRYLRRHYRLQPEVFISSGHYAPHLSKPDPALATLPQNRFIEAIRNYNGTPTAFFEDQELMELVLPVLRADFSICETYHYTPEEPLDCPIIAYGGTQDPDADPVDLLAWRDQTHRNVSVRVFPGDHFYIETVSDLLLRSLIKDLREFATPLMERRTRKDSEHE